MLDRQVEMKREFERDTSKDITRLGAETIARRIRAGELSAREVVEAHIERIESVNERLNAVVIPTFDRAREDAAHADREFERGETLGLLHGVPVTIKEQYSVSGTEVTIGLLSQKGHRSEADGPLVAKLRKAGAIILGKTNVPQLLTAWETDSPVYGRANNPWNLDRSPGGSSGGEAAIIAAGGSPLGLGGDLGGSIRTPAHFCGIHGLKPTSGRLTNGDVPGYLFGTGQEAILAQPGPMARCVADLRLAMKVLSAPGDRATVDMVPPVPWRDPFDTSVANLRVGFFTDNGLFSSSPALRRATEEAASALERLGAHVESFTPPSAADAMRLFLGIMSADGARGMKRLLAGQPPHQLVRGLIQGGTLPRLVRPIVAAMMESRGQAHLAATLRSMGARTAAEYWDLVDARTAYRARYVEVMDELCLDAILCPPFALPALTHGSSEHLLAAASYSITFNVVGMPAGVLAATQVQRGEESDRPESRDMADQTAREVESDSAGLPVGVQVVGRHWREDTVLTLMAALEEHFRGTPSYPLRSDRLPMS